MKANYDLLAAQIDEYPGWRVLGWEGLSRDDAQLVIQNMNHPSPFRDAWDTGMRIESREQWDKLTDKLRQAATLHATRDARPVIYEAEYHTGGLYYGLVYALWNLGVGDSPALPHPEVFKMMRIVWVSG